MKSSLWSGSDRSAPLPGTRALRGRGTTPRSPAKSAAARRCGGGASEAAFAPKSFERSSSDKNASAGKLSSLASSALFWESAPTRWCEVTAPPAIAAASAISPSSKCHEVVRAVSSRLHLQQRRADCRTWRQGCGPLQRARGSRALDGRSPVHLPRLVSSRREARARRDLKQF